MHFFSMSYSRAQVIDYTVPMLIDVGRILSRRGKTEINPWGYFLPLSPVVWLCLISSLMLIMASSFFISVSGTLPNGSSYALENYLRILLGQDFDLPNPRQWSRRLVVATWLVGTLIVMKAYSGNLSSLLIVRYVPQPHHSVRAVLDDPQVTAVMSGGGSFQQTLDSIQSGVFKRLADSKSTGKLIFVSFSQFYDIINNEVSKGTHVILGEDLSLRVLTTKHFSETGSCLFYFSKEQFFSQILAPTIQKNSPLVASINKRIRKITESGLYKHWLDRVFTNASSCNKAPSKILVESSLSLYNVWTTKATDSLALSPPVRDCGVVNVWEFAVVVWVYAPTDR
ncbi:glutamate receptor ionotropic, kainate glr-3-like [Macrobrachium nipponense]|uniref:glutamate receptor ionotropic, kainate glr-3-like n=1 Tax=Macrobrachium nipponense TaxID=159736 RepID=UPI0030C7AA03